MSDTITNELCATDRIYTLSLEKPPDEWARKALDISSRQREDTYDIMKKKGWDIYTEADKLARYYKNGVIK